MINVLIINLGKQYGGAETYIEEIVSKCNKQKFNFWICVRKNSIFNKVLIEKDIEKDHIFDFDLKPEKLICNINNLISLIIREKIYVIHANGINSECLSYYMKGRLKDRKFISTVHGDAEWDRIERCIIIRKFFAKLQRFVLKKMDCIIAVSCSIKNILVERGIKEKNIKVIYNGITTNSEFPRKVNRRNSFRVCSIGRLEKVKGHIYLLKAIKNILYLEKREIYCDIYGVGKEFPVLHKYVNDNNLDKYVNFKGHVKNVQYRLSDYDICVQPSLYESFGITLLEAMNEGVAILCSNVGGMKEIIDNNISGIFFESGCVEEIVKNIVWMMDNPKEIMNIRQNAFAKLIKEYSVDKMICNVEKVYTQIL